MQKTYNPIKRSKELAPLSREHHDALLFVWKIKQGIAYGVPAATIARYCEWYWKSQLSDHFRSEEISVGKLLPSTHHLVIALLDDHEAIESKFWQVIDEPSYHSLKRLAQILYYHIRFEERTLFSFLESNCSVEGLRNAFQDNPRKQQAASTWKEEFWTRTPQLFSTN